VYSDEKSCESKRWGFRVGDRSHAAHPIPLHPIVARTHMYTHAAKVWDLSNVQGLFSVALCQTLALRFAAFSSLKVSGVERAVRRL
jgi:hypothetical protein